ncbi:ComEC/Rec2 family competence protein [Tunicatimonas pelagia]|uniref:ComEC/Rec2 family competence protein n=1 Tax=Tunicatimonas pelagia TaxID=931531 RepID=UPI0026670ECD|nr:ComEC/Rec2 family competence protein [Tunicatimonas pelagia]WKN42553.1 ComEC/Rec2 family competence protein [Tunicatimonas pelagia]
MFRWVPYPFLRFTPFLMLGIGQATYVNSTGATIVLVVVFLSYTGCVFLLPKAAFSRYHPWVAGMASVVIILLGILRTHQQDESRSSDHLMHHTDSADYYIAQVMSQPEPKKNSFRVLLEVEQMVVSGTQTFPRSGQIVVYQPKSDSCQLLQFGDKILVKGLPGEIKPPNNPAEFDYRQFMAYQGIYHQQYLPADRWKVIQAGVVPAWQGWAGRWRSRCREILLRYVQDKQAQGITLAITLGLKSHLEKEVQTAYAAAGAMHVLAVSGLHVGIIYLIVNFLFKPLLSLPKGGVLLHTVLCLQVLWLYAALTGFSPSVQRAAVMFSFVIVGSALNRQSSIYNTLACSAFALLWINPYLMYSVGFQLSYLAVFGIVYLQPKIVAWLEPPNKLLAWAWGLTAVSIAAQIATFPLSLYYFHQFPVYFWISNIVVIPGALVMLPLGLVTLVTGFTIPALAEWVGLLLEKFILAINFLVALVQQLPGSTIENIFISASQTWLLYFAIVALAALFYYRKLRYLSLAVVSLFLIATVQTVRYYQQSKERSLTVYQVKNETYLDFTEGFNNLLWGERTATADYHIRPNHIRKGVHTQFMVDSSANNSVARRASDGVTLFQYHEKVIALVDQKLGKKPKQPVSVNYVVVAKNAVRDLNQLDRYFQYEQLIIDGSNSYYTTRKLTKQAEQKHINCHAVSLQGALIINLNQDKQNFSKMVKTEIE